MTQATETPRARAERVRAKERAHLLFPWSALDRPDTLVVDGAEGSWFWDTEGRRYLDFASQFVHVNIGHQHPRVIEAIKAQAERLCTVSPALSAEPRALAAELIAEQAPPGLDRVFFTNGGAEAVEHAVRMARTVTGRPKIASAYRSYHGATNTAMQLTGDPRRWPNDNGTAGVTHFFGPYLYRSHFHAGDERQECERALAHLADVIAFEGPDTLAAVVLEPVVGTPGILVPPPGYLAGVRELCDRYGILLVADEVMCGFGRTGAWFAVDHWRVRPDLMTFAKGVNSGYVPLGGVLLSDRVAEHFAHRPYPGGLTYAGHPLACAAAVGAITAMREEKVVENAARLGAEVIGPGLRELAERHPSIGEVRGLGVFWALELVRDRATREPFTGLGQGPAGTPLAELEQECRRRRLWPFLNGSRMHVMPPCTATGDEIREGLAALDESLSVLDRHTHR